jgi:hypothetical protein
MTDRIALWRPGWYELDQPLEVGLTSVFAFLADSDPLVFYNTLWEPGRATQATGTIASITHARLGPVKKVDTRGLDYTFLFEDGRRLVVNAEEQPGLLHEPLAGDWQPRPFEPNAWTLTVALTALGPLHPVSERDPDFA